jgi:hypothetical protein
MKMLGAGSSALCVPISTAESYMSLGALIKTGEGAAAPPCECEMRVLAEEVGVMMEFGLLLVVVLLLLLLRGNAAEILPCTSAGAVAGVVGARRSGGMNAVVKRRRVERVSNRHN